jgi:hypothetical protein
VSADVIRIDRNRPEVTRRYAVNSSDRWCTATLAAAFALPPDLRETVDEWVELIDRLDRSIKATLFESARARFEARQRAT